jgi:hypothetical protein
MPSQSTSCQQELSVSINTLVDINSEIHATALRHNPTALIEYLNMLVKTARAQGASGEQLHALNTAKAALVVGLRHGNENERRRTCRATAAMTTVLDMVTQDLRKRTNLDAMKRAKMEKKPCSLYNDIVAKLPSEFKQGITQLPKSAPFTKNLQSILPLVQYALKRGGIVQDHNK